MADLVAADITVTVEARERVVKHRRNRVKLAFGDGSLTYPSGGVPLPAFGKFGMKRNLDYLILTDANDGVGLVWKYDQANKKLRAYVQGVVVGATATQSLDDFPVTAGDGVTADTHVFLKAGSTTARFGGLVEITGAISAQTLYAEAIGF